MMCILMFNCVGAKAITEKYTNLDEENFPNIFKNKTQFKFKEIIISFIDNKNLSYLIFDLILDRDITSSLESQEDDIPAVVDALISDLFPTINLFSVAQSDTLQHSLQQRIDRILKAKFKWITGTKVLNTRIQGSGNE